MPLRLRHIIFLFALLLGASLTHVQAAIPTGCCGDRKPNAEGIIVSDSTNVQWTLYSDSVAFVGEGAMGTTGSVSSSYRSSVKKVSFSKDITFIGRYTLSYMNNLEQITVDPENANYYSPEGSNCLIERANEYDTNIMLGIGNGYIPEGVEVMRNYALCDNYRLTSITIPRSVRQMGEKTPQQGVGYDETPFQLPTLTEIHVQWTSEEELPVWISKKKINNADKIKLYVPCGTKSIYQNAVPWNTCKAIVEEGCCEIDGECGYDETDNVYWSYANCDSLLTISGEGRMKSYEYSTNRPWKDYTNKIKHIVIEEGITEIGRNAFTGFSLVDSVDIPKSVEKIGAYAFRNCSTLKDIYVHWDGLMIPAWDQMTNKLPQSSITLHVPCGYDHLYQERDGWKDYTPVADMPSIKEGTWETNIFWSVDHCDSTLTIAGSGEFRCDYGMWAFVESNRYCVKRAVISKDITYLGIFTLSGCPNMEFIEVEEGNPTHRSGCNAIIRNGNGTEGDTLMFGCKNTVIPPTVTAIRGYAFWDSHKVTEMRIPASVNEIGNSKYPQNILWLIGQGPVFYTSDEEGEGLKDLYVEWTTKEDIPVLKANTLGDMSKVRLHVPCGMAAVYQEVTGWTQFKEYIEEGSPVIVNVNDPLMGSVTIEIIE